MIKAPEGRRVVVTGLGVISSIGIGWQEFWKNLMAGKSGISRIEAFDTSPYDRHYGGEVKNFDPTQFMDKRKAARMGRASQMAVAASKLAVEDARLQTDRLTREKTAVCVGTTTGEIGLFEKFHENRTSYEEYGADEGAIAIFPASSICSSISFEFKLRGRNIIFGNACAAGNYAIGQATDLIRFGKAEIALAGGVDGFSRIVFTGFGRLFAMAPEKCQPFDKNRRGMIMGEGSGILLLEALESAQKRKAPIYAEILGYSLSCDARHMTTPSITGVAKVFKKSLEESCLSVENVDYISAHGTGTPENDRTECRAMKEVFGKRIKEIPISSIKSMLGHTMGAAAAIESISCCLATRDNNVPPTINFEEKDPECDIDCVPNKGRKHQVKVALNNSLAFGGNNACLVFKRFE